MSGFEYSALEATGRETRGVIEADTERHARSLLRERGLAPLTVESIRAAAVQSGRRERFSRPGLSRKGLALITRQFATLVRAGLTIEEGLNVLIEQTESAGARTLFAAVRARVLEGQSLSHSLAEFPNAFPQIRSEEHTLNSSHRCISYAVFCLKKKNTISIEEKIQR